MSPKRCLAHPCQELPLNSVPLCRAHNLTHRVVAQRHAEVAVPKQFEPGCPCPELCPGVKAHRQDCEAY